MFIIIKKKSPGYDLITPELLQMLANIAIQHITAMTNGILRTLTYPDPLKYTVVILIPKPNKPNPQIPSSNEEQKTYQSLISS